MWECGVGFSGILFGLTVTQTASSNESRSLFGIVTVSSKIYPWVLLILIQLLLPGVSFLGHLSGILVGFIYLYHGFDWIQISPTLIVKFESHPFFRRILNREDYVSNPHMGERLNTSGSVSPPLPVWNTTTGQSFPGTGHVLSAPSN
eukprot:TRINITY_DN7904_c0_g1_i3.p1 TRINITY_DN7904_c0_g1~~TRINITY_DN7904_c0_g1_i3.p1  ORF type:complete len:147 (+),score=12.57 TRINITY_DN7904_c0_g1_i3:49-489(+)